MSTEKKNAYNIRQLRGAFGAGMRAAEENASETKVLVSGDPLIGRWFHSFEDPQGKGPVVWQGQVRAGDGKLYMVQLFDWVAGDPTSQRLVSVEEMKNWSFYESSADMLECYATYLRHRRTAGDE